MPKKQPAHNKTKAKAAFAPSPTAPDTPTTSTELVPSGRATLLRIESIHVQLKAVRPGSKARVTVNSLAADLGVSEGTVKADLALMEIFNAPIGYDPKRRTKYYLDPTYELRPPVWLTERQGLALLVAIRMAAHSRIFPVGADLVSAWDAIKPSIAGGAGLGPATLDPVVSTPPRAGTEAEAKHFAALCAAILHRREVTVVYCKAQHEPALETRTLHPLHWYVHAEACLLVAHEPGLGARRNFELMRIQEVRPTGSSFLPPADFNLENYLAGAFGRFVGEAVHTVRVRIDRDYVPRMLERPWQHEKLVPLPDGSAEATFHVCHTADLEQNVLRAGGAVEVLGPPEVRERIAAAAERILAKHGAV